MRPIDADALGNRMYHESFEKDSDLQRWDGGCWIRYKLFEQVLREAPTIDPTHSTPSNTLGTLDCVDRQAAIDALKICDNNEDGINCHKCPLRDERWDGAWQDDETNCYTKLMRDSAKLLEMPSAESERKKGKWKRRIVDSGYNADWICSECGHRVKTDFVNYNFCPKCGADMRGDNNDS